jgi:hypothetical protein
MKLFVFPLQYTLDYILSHSIYSSLLQVVIPYGNISEFIIIDSTGAEHLLRAENNSTDVSG